MLWGAVAGALVPLTFVAAAIVAGDAPPFDAPGSEVASHLEERRTRIQLAAGLNALWLPLFVWFLATVAWLGRRRPAAIVALGCGLVFAAVFAVDVTALAAGALRPGNIAAAPELAAALRDLEWLSMGVVAPVVSAMLVAFAALSGGADALWPGWIGRLALVAAAAYALRTGTLFTTDGPFAADGVLGLWLPVAALAGWFFIAAVALALRVRRPAARPG